jgi:hypothetical protein
MMPVSRMRGRMWGRTNTSDATERLWLAVEDGNRDDADKAFQDGALTKKWRGGISLLHHAAAWGRTELIPTIIIGGGDVNARAEGSDQTPLFWAAQHGHSDAVRCLLSMGAWDRPDHLGQLALHVAVRHRDVAVVKELLNGSHSDINQPDGAGKTPLMYALEGQQNSELVHLLVQYGAKTGHAATPDDGTVREIEERSANLIPQVITEAESVKSSHAAQWREH